MPAIVTAGVSANSATRAAKVEIRARPLMPVRVVVVVVNAPAAERSFWPASLIAVSPSLLPRQAIRTSYKYTTTWDGTELIRRNRECSALCKQHAQAQR